MRINLTFLMVLLSAMVLFTQCEDDPSCTDGIQNQGETGIDCGDAESKCPPCDAAIPTCDDGIQNGGETGVDCGGNCPNECADTASCSDGIQNGTEAGVDCGGDCPPCQGTSSGQVTATIGNDSFASTASGATVVNDVITITATQGSMSLNLTYGGSLEAGTYDVEQGFIAAVSNSDNAFVCTAVAGSITFSTFSQSPNFVSGTFNFECIDPTTGNSTMVSNGAFENIAY